MKNISTFKKAFYYIQVVWITLKSEFSNKQQYFPNNPFSVDFQSSF